MKQQALSFSFIILGGLTLILVVTGIAFNLPTFLLISHIALWVVPGIIGVCLVYMGVRRLIYDTLDIKVKHLTVAQQQQALTHTQEKHQLEQHLALTRIAADANSNYPILLPQVALPYEPIVFQSTRLATRVTEEKTVAAAQPSQLVAPGMKQPSQRYLLEQLEENALQVSPGIRASDGQPIILSIPDAVHFKLIGSSGFGKSCLAAALLDQAITLNSPEYLQIALLDLEHKTSRLFENSPNVFSMTVGRRNVPMVATNADEVAVHLGYLKRELDRRAQLSEYDLQYEPLLLIYVEEMLSLQLEVDARLIDQMLKDLSVLAVRARKYNMFLLACSQTDYSTPELRTAQKQFRSRIAFAVDTTAARAAGFMSTDLIKYSFSHSQKGDGLYVLETPGIASLMLSPVYNVKQKVLALDARSSRFQHVSNGFQDGFTSQPLRVVSSDRKGEKPLEKPYVAFSENNEKPENSRLSEVVKLREMAWGKVAIIEKIWGVKPGGSLAWKQAAAEYEAIIAEIEQQKVEEA